jgi:hypothetical protein
MVPSRRGTPVLHRQVAEIRPPTGKLGPWPHELKAFAKHRKTLAAAARTPTMQAFSERFKNGPDRELTSITNGAGDVIDFDPKLSRNAFDGDLAMRNRLGHKINSVLMSKVVDNDKEKRWRQAPPFDERKLEEDLYLSFNSRTQTLRKRTGFP